jgi:hypothetical protein
MLIQSRPRLMTHGNKLDAHSLAQTAVAHPGPGTHIAAGNLKDKLYEVTNRRWFWRGNK